jgi:ankyrin repeat protein
MSKKMSLKHIFLLIDFMVISLKVLPQAEIVNIDTSEYLPLSSFGALEYNLMIAASKGYDTEIERMALMGADIDIETEEGATPLIFAVQNDKTKSAYILIKYGADVNRITNRYETPLTIAVRNQNFEIAETLIRYGAEVNYIDNYGATPLHYASIYGYIYITDLLLYYGAETDQKAFDGTTPLMAAIWAGHANVADLLIQNGANMEARDNEGFTPFLIAAQNGDTLIMNLLRQKGVDIYTQNKYRWDALDITIRADQENAAEILIKSGDRWTDPERKAINPYNIAVRYSRKDIIKLLERNEFPTNKKLEVDQLALTLSFKSDFRDIFTGISFAFKEPLLNLGFIAGLDTKLWHTRVLVKENDYLYYQYLDRSSIVHAGVFKDFPLTDNMFKSNILLSPSLSAAYSFGSKFKGTLIRPDNCFKVIPCISLKWIKNNIILISGVEFMNTDFHRIGPVWGRFGVSYNFFFDNERAPVKIIKWY